MSSTPELFNILHLAPDYAVDTKELSAGALGLLAIILTIPNEGTLIKSDLSSLSSNGRDGTKRLYQELVDRGIILEEPRFRKIFLLHPIGPLNGKVARTYTNIRDLNYAKVYLMRQEGTGFYKIGITNNVTKRLKTMQSGSPYELTVLYTFRGTQKDELALHEKFDLKRVRGEWFKLDGGDIAYIIQYFKSI